MFSLQDLPWLAEQVFLNNYGPLPDTSALRVSPSLFQSIPTLHAALRFMALNKLLINRCTGYRVCQDCVAAAC